MKNGTFQVYRTSAGAGKTYTIVKEYILLYLSGNAKFDSTAAITFTNKAANEMKDRIVEYLFEISNDNIKKPEIQSLIEQLTQESSLSQELVVEKCKELLHHILHKYARFTITTIDSFIHDILRIFSFDLKLPDNFNVELDTKSLSDMIVSQLLHELDSHESQSPNFNLSSFIIQIAMSRFEEKDKWDITNELISFAELLFNENALQHISGLSNFSIDDFNSISKSLHKSILHHLDIIRTTAGKAIKTIHDEGHSVSDFYQGKRGIYQFFNSLKEVKEDGTIEPNSFVQTTIEEDKWTPANKADISHALKQSLNACYQAIMSNPIRPFLKLMNSLRLQMGVIALLSRMQNILDDYKEQNQILPISDFNVHISKIVKNEPAPFIYERIGQKYKHFLIDEFQDTSVMQWQNFLPLIENSLSLRNNVFVVGDVKQSIYRFRSGEFEQLMNLPEIYNKPNDIPHLNDVEQLITLCFEDRANMPQTKNINYRSGEHIVNTNNTHFEWIREQFAQAQSNDYVVKAYENLTQGYKPSAKGKGYVRFYPLEKEEYLNTVLQQILEIVQQKSNYGHIAILTRGREKSKLIASFLMRQNPPVPVISSESLELGFSPAVCFVMDMLKIIQNNSNHLAMVGAYTYLLAYDDSISVKYANHHLWLNEVLIQTPKTQWFQVFSKWLKDSGYACDFMSYAYMPIDEVVSEIVSVFGLARPVDSYILFFQNKLIDFLKENNEGLLGVLKWWETRGSSEPIIIPEGTNAVRILTIHKSKGLQFPCVIYPFADFKLRQTLDKVWVPVSILPNEVRDEVQFGDLKSVLVSLSLEKSLPLCELKTFLQQEIMKQELDTLNIHYVAMTRARDELHVLFKNESSNKDYGVNHLIARYLKEKFKTCTTTTEENTHMFQVGEMMVNESEGKNELGQPLLLNTYHLRSRSSVKTRTVRHRNNDAQQIGNLFHNFMSQINDLKDLENKLDVFCSNCCVGDYAKGALLNMIQQYQANEQIRSIYSLRLTQLNEATVVHKHQLFRPDKIFYNDEQTHVIDYKTGRKHKHHHEQISGYCQLLAKMGFKNIDALLVYVEEDAIDIERVSIEN
jgi:ATP-dependent exoDNAse (exonuclease V) beta subunit